METPAYLLPTPEFLQFDAIKLDEEACILTLELSATGSSATCPVCQQTAVRVHSRYYRTVADLPWAGRPVRIHLHVRRFFCDTAECQRLIFTERLPRVVAPWSRRTQRLLEAQQAIGLAVGGAGGARLSAKLAMTARVDVLLTLIRQVKLPEPQTPRVLGVDDWAKRKGCTYGTILVDLERSVVIDLLTDRTAETLAQWLRAHPGVEIVSRDRAEAYGAGIRQGAPHAMQVADRWHLLKNMVEVVGKVLQQHDQAIQQQLATPAVTATAASVCPSDSAVSDMKLPVTATLPPPLPVTNAQQSAAEQRRQERAATAQRLHEQGWQHKAIAQHLHLAPKTVRRYLRTTLPLTPQRRTRTRLLDSYRPFLLERWNAGCHNAAHLLRDLQARGFTGHYTSVRTVVAQLRLASGLPPRSRRKESTPLARDPTERPPTPRSLTWLILRKPESLTEEEQQTLSRLAAIHPHLTTTVQLAQAFATLIRQRQVDQLEGWLAQAKQSSLATWQTFAQSLSQDLAAVRAALETAWSNGPTEGHVNRLKCLKRQMYGRAKLDLLRQRLLAT